MTFGIYVDSGEEVARETASEPTREELSLQINTLQREVERLGRYVNLHSELEMKIDNVKGYIYDQATMNGELSDDLKEIAEYLDITLTKEINGTATLEISWSATVPMEFDASDLEISFSVECDTDEAHDFWYEDESTEVNGEDA